MFVLEPTNTLRIRVEGRDVSGLPCVVRSEVGMFAGRRGADFFDDNLQGQDLNYSASGRTLPDGSTQWCEYTVRIAPDTNGKESLWRAPVDGSAVKTSVLDGSFAGAPQSSSTMTVVALRSGVGSSLRAVSR